MFYNTKNQISSKVAILTFIILFISFKYSYSQLLVNKAIRTPAEAETLIRNYLLGNGITISNVSWSGFYYTTNTSGQIASFNNGNTTNLGIKKGIIMSTGDVLGAPGPNDNTRATTDWYCVCSEIYDPYDLCYTYQIAPCQHTDTDLESLLVGATDQSYDAAVLEFDFIPASTPISFKYVFASEEYPEYVCSQFNDVFGFFVTSLEIDGLNYNKKNIALIPETNLPVAINSVNPGVPGSQADGGACNLSYSDYYVNNGDGTTPDLNPSIQYDGFTTILTAKLDVIPCKKYHIKLAITDVYDGQFDSGVFLEAGSFSSNALTVNTTYSNPKVDSVAVKGCSNATVTFTLPKPTQNDTIINYVIGGSGTAVNGLDYNQLDGKIHIGPGQTTGSFVLEPFLNGQNPGNLTFTFDVEITACTGMKTYTINIKDNPALTITPGTESTICNGKSVNLTSNPAGGFGAYTYLWSNNEGTGKNVTVNPSVNTTYTVTVTDVCNSKINTNYKVNVNPLPEAKVTPDGPLNFCTGGSVNLVANSGANYTYQWKNGSSIINGQTTSSYHASSAGNYTVVITNSNLCTNTSSVTSVTINTKPVATVTANGALVFCKGNTVSLNANAGSGYNYQWKNDDGIISGATNISFVADESGIYSVIVSKGGCSDTSDVKLVTVNPFPLFSVSPSSPVSFCKGDSVALEATPADGLKYQWSNNNISISGATNNSYMVKDAGKYSVEVINSFNCSKKSDQIEAIVTKPKAEIANGDTSICQGSEVVLSANAGENLSYKWLKDGVLINNATNANYTAISDGDFSVIVASSVTCFDTSKTMFVKVDSLL